MATADEITCPIGQITGCSLCLGTFKEPKALPCIHTFCLQCLASHCENKNETEIACPLCRQNFSIPPGGLQNLPNNFFIHQLIQINTATASRSHQGVSDVDIPSSEKRLKLSASYCHAHPNEQNILYCNDCNVVMSHKCLVRKPNQLNQHKLSDENESAKKFREQITQDIKNMSIYVCREKKNIHNGILT